MPRFLPVLILLLAACRPPAYVQPTPDQPHAILKIRHIVHAQRGPMYASAVRIGEFAVDERTLEGGQNERAIIHLRVHPGPDAFAVAGHSYHMEMQMVTRYRTVQESYSCPQQECSGGYGTSPRTCRTAYRTCTRSRQESYQTMQSVPVIDDQCQAGFPLDPRPGATYLMQFDYLGENDCQMSCFEQVANGSGGFTLNPCAPAVLPPG
jgi:hypothetical protein